MKDARKRFDPKLYEENDTIAKDFVRELLKGTQYQVVDNPKKRGVDLFVYKDSKHICNLECEIKRLWKDAEFPYENVNFPKRKEKYAQLDKPTVFMMMNNDQSCYLTVHGKDLLTSPCVEVPNRYVYQGEYFFQVPKDQVLFNNLIKILEEVESST